MNNKLNGLFGGEVEKFIDSEMLDGGSRKTNRNQDKSSEDFERQSDDIFGGMLSELASKLFTISKGSGAQGVSEMMTSGGGEFKGFSIGDEKEKTEEEKEEKLETWQKDKTDEQKEKAQKRKGTKGELQGNAPKGEFYKAKKDSYISVQSSNIKAVKYDNETKQLNVQFVSGTEYSYDNVPKAKFNALLTQSSHGSYFYFNIRGKGVPKPKAPPYQYHKL